MARRTKSMWIQLLLNLSERVDARVCLASRHSIQVAQWVVPTAKLMKCTSKEVQAAYWAAMLHDIGKIGVPDEVLSKPGPLTPEEWILMRMHPLIGANIVKSFAVLESIAPVVVAHQERFDGNGYPLGLRGEAIPVGARILAVIDAFDAMTNDRVYRKAYTYKEAVAELIRRRGKDFDPRVVDAFMNVVSPF